MKVNLKTQANNNSTTVNEIPIDFAIRLKTVENTLKKHSMLLGFILGLVLRDINQEAITIIKMWLSL